MIAHDVLAEIRNTFFSMKVFSSVVSRSGTQSLRASSNNSAAVECMMMLASAISAIFAPFAILDVLPATRGHTTTYAASIKGT